MCPSWSGGSSTCSLVEYGTRQRSVRMPQNGQQPTKKPYTTPTLIAYGDVQKITEGGTGGKKFDSFPMRS